MKTTIEKPFEEKNATTLSVGSFIVSTILFTLYLASGESPNIFVIAWPFVLAAIVLNIIMVTHLADNLIKHPKQRKYIAGKILLLLINIPIVYFYYSIVIKL